MHKYGKKLAAAALSVFLLLSYSTQAMAAGSTKDETVYVNLSYSGNVSDINVVNSFKGFANGQIKDYGQYDKITNLTDESVPHMENGVITWSLNKANPMDAFYYQGKLNKHPLPWSFTIKYFLDGKETKAEKLAGASGKIGITIDVKANNAANEYFKKKQMLQITLPLDADKCTSILAPEGTQMLTGHTKTLAYSVLPGKSQTFDVTFQGKDFEMKGFTMTIMEANLSMLDTFDETTNGINDMLDGMDDLLDGTTKLKNGLSDLSEGISSLRSGSTKLAGGRSKLVQGADSFADGLTVFSNSLQQAAEGSKKINGSLGTLSAQAAPIQKGYSDVEKGLEQMLAQKQALMTLAQQLSKSSDPATVQLAQAMLMELEGISRTNASLKALNQGLSSYTNGIANLAAGYDELDKGIQSASGGASTLATKYKGIQDGIDNVFDGISSLNSGIIEMDKEVKGIPGKVGDLIEGQQKMRDGISDAKDEIDSALGTTNKKIDPVSFVAPGKITPSSVQFVLRTPDIKKPEGEKPQMETNPKSLSIWQRFINLFIK